MRRFESELQPLDYLLSFIATSMAILATGYSLRIENTGWLFVLTSAIGHFISAKVFRPDVRWGKFTLDGFLVMLVVIGSFMFADELNLLLPDGGFPPALLTNGILVMIISFSSFVVWRDSSLVFLGVPAIAIFGLVGAYDTIIAAPAMFFVFLICAGIVYSRANLRVLYGLAKTAGEPDVERLRKYAWKGMAGPEWAFASAVAVIALSALGAPVIRETVQVATEPIRVQVRNIASQNNRGPQRIQEGETAVQVGRGPIGTPSEIPVIYATMDEPHYLRTDAFYVYEGARWVSLPLNGSRVGSDGPEYDLSRRNTEAIEISSKEKFNFEVQVLRGIGDRIPIPGVPEVLNGPLGRLRIRDDGSVRPGIALNRGYTVTGTSIKPSIASSRSAPIPGYFRDTFFQSRASERVRNFALDATEGAETEWEMAEALRFAVSRQIKYNLQAPEISPDSDAVEAVLFQTREGYCDLFATSLAILARELNLPSRVATGFLVRPEDRDRGRFVVREKDYHMWTEIYFEGMGWVIFDATEGADEVPGAGRGDTVQERESLGSTLMAQLVPILIGLGLAGLAVAVFWEKIRDFLVSARIQKTSEKVVKARTFEFIGDGIADLERASKIPREFGWTIQEYCAVIRGKYPASADSLRLIPNQVDAILYGAQPLTPELREQLEASFKQSANEIRQDRKSNEA